MRGPRSLAAPLLVAILAVPFLADAVHRASWSTLGRDQGIFQYVAWAIGRGDKLYTDIRDVNGPLVALIHLVFQALGGADEHRFRVLDLVFSSAAFLFIGSAIPDIAGVPSPPRTQRAAWAIAAWAVLMAQYVLYGYWETAQRESFFDWFLLASIALQARAQTRAPLLALAGAASMAPWFGKPTYAFFTIAQLVAIGIERRRSVVPFLLGALGCAVLLVSFLAAVGDLRAFTQIMFVDVPTMYRFIWPRPPLAIVALPGYDTLTGFAVLAFGVATALVFLKKLPVRAVPVATMPALGLASVFVQAKGFPYHFHPVTLGIGLVWLVVLAWTWHGTERARVLVLAGAAALGAHAAWSAWRAPFPPAPSGAADAPERLAWFNRVDYFPNAMRSASAYLAAKTKPDDRVQLYGMDAYLLFLAKRASATPYIYAYDLDADAALAGSWDSPSMRPNAAQAAAIRALRDSHERDLVSRVSKSPPAAFVFVGRSPLMSSSDAVADFFEHCPDAAKFVTEHYRETADFEGIRVWLRNDQPP